MLNFANATATDLVFRVGLLHKHAQAGCCKSSR